MTGPPSSLNLWTLPPNAMICIHSFSVFLLPLLDSQNLGLRIPQVTLVLLLQVASLTLIAVPIPHALHLIELSDGL
jgi:hypothetical protein